MLIREIRRNGSRRLPVPLNSPVRYWFGSVTKGRLAVGLKPLHRKWTREIVLRELRARHRAAVQGPLALACKRLFGSVTSARRAAGVPLLRVRRR